MINKEEFFNDVQRGCAQLLELECYDYLDFVNTLDLTEKRFLMDVLTDELEVIQKRVNETKTQIIKTAFEDKEFKYREGDMDFEPEVRRVSESQTQSLNCYLGYMAQLSEVKAYLVARMYSLQGAMRQPKTNI